MRLGPFVYGPTIGAAQPRRLLLASLARFFYLAAIRPDKSRGAGRLPAYKHATLNPIAASTQDAYTGEGAADLRRV